MRLLICINHRISGGILLVDLFQIIFCVIFLATVCFGFKTLLLFLEFFFDEHMSVFARFVAVPVVCRYRIVLPCQYIPVSIDKNSVFGFCRYIVCTLRLIFRQDIFPADKL